jgi:hypothetical protein
MEEKASKAPLVEMGRPRKTTISVKKIELHPVAFRSLQILEAKGRHGNRIQDIIVNLLNDRLKQLETDGGLDEQRTDGTAIPFPQSTSSETDAATASATPLPRKTSA